MDVELGCIALAHGEFAIAEVVAPIRNGAVGTGGGAIQHLHQQLAFGSGNDASVHKDLGGKRLVERGVQQSFLQHRTL